VPQSRSARSPARPKRSSPRPAEAHPITETLESRAARASRALVLGIGGGGDVVGCLAVTRQLEAMGLECELGGVAWERFPVDPYPGPRSLADIHGATPIGTAAALVDPAVGATTPEGAHFCESRLATHLGERTVLIDVTGGPEGARAGIADAAAELGCDLVVLTDIGGDAIASGGESGLASPLCDAVMIAAGATLAPELGAVLGVLGAGCDGELEPAEVLARVACLARAGAWLGTAGVSPAAAAEIEAAAQVAVTEASLLVARCARGEYGSVEIRDGRRTVQAGPLGAVCFLFDLEDAMAELPLARAVAGASSIADAHHALVELGIGTELGYERRRATGTPGGPE